MTWHSVSATFGCMPSRRASTTRCASRRRYSTLRPMRSMRATLRDKSRFGTRALKGLTATLPAKYLGRNAIDVLCRDPADFMAADRELMVTGVWEGEMVRRTKSGRDITVAVRWTLVRHPDGQPKSILAINTDITEKKALESQFLRAQRMEGIGTLAGGLAHDLNNVLAPIMMSIEMLKTLVKDSEGISLLSTLQGSAQRGATLVRQVLSFARGSRGTAHRRQTGPRHERSARGDAGHVPQVHRCSLCSGTGPLGDNRRPYPNASGASEPLRQCAGCDARRRNNHRSRWTTSS